MTTRCDVVCMCVTCCDRHRPRTTDRNVNRRVQTVQTRHRHIRDAVCHAHDDDHHVYLCDDEMMMVVRHRELLTDDDATMSVMNECREA